MRRNRGTERRKMKKDRITEVSVNDKEKWNEVVRSFADYDVFYLNDYVQAFQLENPLNGEPVLIYYEKGTDRAMNVIFKRDIAGRQENYTSFSAGGWFSWGFFRFPAGLLQTCK